MQVNEQNADRPAGSAADIPRKKQPKTKLNGGLPVPAVLVVGGITFGLSRLKAAAPTVDRSSVWTDTVKRGSMLRQGKGPGSLGPEQIRWTPADTAGRIEPLPLRPGARIEAGTTLMEL